MISDRVVGRDHELAVAATFLDGLAAKAGALLIEGEAGIGKTAVVRAVAAAAETRGYCVLRCAGEEAEARFSFVGLADLADDAIDEVRGALPDVQQEALDVATLRTTSPSGRDPDRRAVGAALSSLLKQLAQSRPTLVVVDDVGWLDSATTNALAFAARRIAGQRIGVVTAIRSPAEDIDPLGLRRALGDDGTTGLGLGPIDVDALLVLIERHVGTGFAQPVLRRIATAAGGNPLYALEIARALRPDVPLEVAVPLPVPDNLRELVARRVAALPDAARTALLAAAALTHPSAAVVETVSSQEALAAAEVAGLLRVQRGQVRFAHPLYASAVYASAATHDRRALHRRLATLVGDTEERVRHLALGAPGPDAAVAQALEDAVTCARSRGAWETAGELLELAHTLTPRDERDAASRRAVSAAEHHVYAGDWRRARSILEDVLSAGSDSQTRCRALRLLGEIEYENECFTSARSIFEESLHLAHDPQSRALAHLDLSVVCTRHEIELAAEHADAALRAAEQSGDRGLIAEALAAQVMVSFRGGFGVDWAKMQRSLKLEDTRRMVPSLLRPHRIAFRVGVHCRPLAQASALFDKVLAMAVGRGDDAQLAHAFGWMTFLMARAGRLEEARVHLAAAARQVAFAEGANKVWVLAHATLVKALSGDTDGARADAAEAAALAAGTESEYPLARSAAALALLANSLGDPVAAWNAVEGYVDRVEATGVGDLSEALFVPEGIEALVALGELDRADHVLTLWHERAGALDRSWALAAAGRCRAVLCAARGDTDGALDAVDGALIEHKRDEMPIELGRTLLVQGQIRRRQREKRSAGASIQAALDLFEHSGAALWTQRARAELERLGQRRPTHELTATEARVAALVAEGGTNKQVARALFVSPKTVETNLSRVYRKLGIASRAQLGAEMTRRAAS